METKYKTVEHLFKYGEFKEEETNTFKTKMDLDNHIANLKSQHDSECYKWELVVYATDLPQFTIKLDL